MKEREYLVSLYELYSKLLTQKERSFFEYYYFEDYSLQETADNNSVSKAYVGKSIKSINNKLINFENSLNLYSRNNKIRDIIKDLDEDTISKIEELL